jgi:hypothetical protein
MLRDVGDIIDRWSIAKLKAERIGTDDNKKELEAFEKALTEVCGNFSQFDWMQFKQMMLDINDFIWQLEAGLKSGKEKLHNSYYLLDEQNSEVLARIGLTTILIRNFNHLRVNFKNIVNKLTGTGFMDIKKNHLSEEKHEDGNL